MSDLIQRLLEITPNETWASDAICQAVFEIQRLRLEVRRKSEQTTLPDKVLNDTLVDIHEASRILGFSPKWIYRRVKTLPFVRRVGGRLRFSALGLQKYLTNV